MQKIFKKILVFLLCVVAIVCCIPYDYVSADSNIAPEYGEYNAIVYFYGFNQARTEAYGYYLAEIENDYIYWSGDNEPSLCEGGFTGFDIGLYFVNLTHLTNDSAIYYRRLLIDESIAYNSYLSDFSTYSYNLGYQWALSEDNNDNIYNQGLNYGRQVGYQEGYTDGKAHGYTLGEEHGYDLGYDYGFSAGENSQVASTGFYTMLKTIALYPVEIFTTGLNVDIFGVNVGGFLLGIGMLALVFFLLRKFLGR